MPAGETACVAREDSMRVSVQEGEPAIADNRVGPDPRAYGVNSLGPRQRGLCLPSAIDVLNRGNQSVRVLKTGVGA